MSLSQCKLEIVHQSPVKSLFPQAEHFFKDYLWSYFKRHLYRASDRKKASYSIEAAVALPVFMCFGVCILFFIRILMIGWAIDAAMTTAVDTVAVSSDDPSLFAAEALFYEELLRQDVDVDAVQGGIYGISLLESSIDSRDVTLSATYRICLPIKLFSREGLYFHQKKSARIWNGYDPDETDEPDVMVYVTPYGKAYHCSKTCPYINPSIVSVETAMVSEHRNSGGHRYSLCPLCKNDVGDIVYITSWGDCYHGSISCSGLKRTLSRMKLSEAKERYHPCPKCGDR